MLQSIKRASVVDPENGELHMAIVDFVLSGKSYTVCTSSLVNLTNTGKFDQTLCMCLVDSSRSDLPEAIQTVIEESILSLTNGVSLTELNREFLKKHNDSLDHIICG